MDSRFDATVETCQPALEHDNKAPFRAHIDTPDLSICVARALLVNLGEPPSSDTSDLIIICIGTDRSTGDALGPLVGSKLSAWRIVQERAQVMGTLDKPVHAGNISEVIDAIRRDQLDGCKVLAVDACLGKLGSVGYITVSEGPLKPGTGVNKDLPSVGNAHITGIVNVGGFMEYLVLQNTRLSLVIKMADAIANGIIAYVTGAYPES